MSAPVCFFFFGGPGGQQNSAERAVRWSQLRDVPPAMPIDRAYQARVLSQKLFEAAGIRAMWNRQTWNKKRELKTLEYSAADTGWVHGRGGKRG